MTRIDPARFLQLRLRSGLSSREIEAAGLSGQVWAAIESGRSNRLTLEKAGRAVKAFGGKLSELLEEDPPPAPIDEIASGEDDGDAALLESILFVARRRVRWATLASQTGWPKDRVERALHKLETQLEGRGIRLALGNQVCHLRAASEGVVRKELLGFERQTALREGVTLAGYKALYLVFTSERSAASQIEATSFATRIALATLLNAGILVSADRRSGKVADQADRQRIQLSADVLFALEPLLGTRTNVPAEGLNQEPAGKADPKSLTRRLRGAGQKHGTTA